MGRPVGIDSLPPDAHGAAPPFLDGRVSRCPGPEDRPMATGDAARVRLAFLRYGGPLDHV